MDREHTPTDQNQSAESSTDYAALLVEAQAPQAETEAKVDVKEQANYEGNWMNLQRDRMDDTDFRFKFDQFRKEHVGSLRPGEPTGLLDKPKKFQPHYEQQLSDFDSNLEKIYSSVSYQEGNVSEKRTLGNGNIGRAGTVFSNGESGGVALEGRQKDIIAAHEAYHGMVDTQGSDIERVKGGFDWENYGKLVNAAVEAGEKINPNYLQNPDELMARMAQLKNYYGMKSEQPFTKDHLDHARSNYVVDTGLDNNMSLFMGSVTENTEDEFLRLMNTLPV